MPHGAAHCLGRRGDPTFPEPTGQFSVSSGLSIGNLQQQLPHRLAEGTPLGRQGGELWKGLSGEIGVQPDRRLLKDRNISPRLRITVQSCGKIFLSLNPEADDGLAVRGQMQDAKGGVILCQKGHRGHLTFSLRVPAFAGSKPVYQKLWRMSLHFRKFC